jgi:hypothetical protein
MGLSLDGGRTVLSKNLRASFFKKYLSIEPNFSRIHSGWAVDTTFKGAQACDICRRDFCSNQTYMESAKYLFSDIGDNAKKIIFL